MAKTLSDRVLLVAIILLMRDTTVPYFLVNEKRVIGLKVKSKCAAKSVATRMLTTGEEKIMKKPANESNMMNSHFIVLTICFAKMSLR